MKPLNNTIIKAQELNNDILSFIFEFLPFFELKMAAEVNKAWYMASEENMMRLKLYAALAEWKDHIGPTLYHEIATSCPKPIALLQTLEQIYHQIATALIAHSKDIIDYLVTEAKQKPELIKFIALAVTHELEESKAIAWNLTFIHHELAYEIKRQSAIAIVRLKGWTFLDLQDNPQCDKNIVLAAVKQRGWILGYASTELQNDKEVVLTAVKQFGYALRYASAELQNDKETVLSAVKQFGYALKYASTELQNDKGIVLAAVKQWGCALGDASTTLKNDKEIVLAAIKQSRRAWLEASLARQAEMGIMMAKNAIVYFATICYQQTVKELTFFISSCKDLFSSEYNHSAKMQRGQYGLLLGIAAGFIVGAVISLLVTGAIVFSPWSLGMLASCIVAGAIIGCIIGLLSDDQPIQSNSVSSIVSKTRVTNDNIPLEKRINFQSCNRYASIFKPLPLVKKNQPAQILTGLTQITTTMYSAGVLF